MRTRKWGIFLVFIFIYSNVFGDGKETMNYTNFILKIDFYSAKIKAGRLAGIKERKLVSYRLDRDKISGKELTALILNRFENEIDKLDQYAAYNKRPEPGELEQTKWLSHGFLIDISVPVKMGKNDSNASFIRLGLLDLKDNFKIQQEIEIDEDELILAAARKKDNMMIFALQAKRISEPYRSTFHFDNFVIYTKKGRWKDDEFSKPRIDFPGSKAEFKKGGKDIVLSADNIVYDRAKNRLIGEKATVRDQKGRKLAEGRKVIVPVDNPEKIEIVKGTK